MSKIPLSNRKLEIVAQQLAKGATAADASIAAGYRTNGAAFAANCRQRANYREVKSRVAALQAKAAERLTVDLAWIYERLVEIASRAPYNEEIRTSDKLRAIDMLIRLRGFYAPEKKVVAPADSKSVRLTQVFDAEQLKARMTVVELAQVVSDESLSPEIRLEAAKAALPFCQDATDEKGEIMARKTGVRKTASPGRLEKLIAQLQASGDTTRLLEIMRDTTMPPKARLEAAKAAAPFFHTPISPIDDDDDTGTNNAHTFA